MENTDYMELIDTIMDCGLSDEIKLDIIYRLAIGMDNQIRNYRSFVERGVTNG